MEQEEKIKELFKKLAKLKETHSTDEILAHLDKLDLTQEQYTEKVLKIIDITLNDYFKFDILRIKQQPVNIQKKYRIAYVNLVNSHLITKSTRKVIINNLDITTQNIITLYQNDIKRVKDNPKFDKTLAEILHCTESLFLENFIKHNKK